MNSIIQLVNFNNQTNDYLFCPSENCLNIPEIDYSYNPLKNELQYKCKCSNDQKINITIQDFLEKSSLICYECKKVITDSNFLFCKNCNNIIDTNCEKYHLNNNNHINLELFNKKNLLNCCKEDKLPLIFRCMNCNESLCNLCDLNSHIKKGHSLKQISEFSLNQKELDNINDNFNKQKNILEKIKDIYNTFIKNLENDIIIKQKIINSFQDNEADYCSIINLKNLFINNNEKYENILTNILKEENNINSNDINIDKFIDIILLPFYYSLMINKNEKLNEDLISNISNKINNIKKVKEENNELSLFSNLNDLNKLNFNNQQIKQNKKDNNKNQKRKSPSIKKSKEKKNKSDSELEKEKKKNKSSNKTEQNNNFVNNMIALHSGNFAISIQRRIEIYNFKKLNYKQKQNVFDNDLIKKSQCLLQKIYFDKGSKGKFISYIFQFVDETLLCPIYSKIIRIKLTNEDKNYEIIGCINLEFLELSRKIISLGDSMLIILSEKGDDCKIKIYSKQSDNLDNNNINNYNIINNEFNSICQTFGIFNNDNNNNNKQNNPVINKEKDNIIINNDINKENIIQNNNNNNNLVDEIKEDSDFKMLLDNINDQNKLWVSMYEIKKSNNNELINKENYLYEFIATSNAEFASGQDKIIFYGIKKVFGKYITNITKEITGISCSCEANTICQLNNKYLCIGLQNYGKDNQKNGFALIDIYKKELYKIIQGDNPISCLCFIKEKQLLFAVMENIEEGFFLTKAYKLVINKEKDKEKDLFDINLNNIYQHRNKQNDVITTINTIKIKDNINNKNIIFVTSSQSSHLEIVNEEIEC